MVQDAVLGLGSNRLLELHVRMLHLTHRVRKCPDDIENEALHSAAVRSKQTPKGVKLAMTSDHGVKGRFHATPLVITPHPPPSEGTLIETKSSSKQKPEPLRSDHLSTAITWELMGYLRLHEVSILSGVLFVSLLYRDFPVAVR